MKKIDLIAKVFSVRSDIRFVSNQQKNATFLRKMLHFNYILSTIAWKICVNPAERFFLGRTFLYNKKTADDPHPMEIIRCCPVYVVRLWQLHVYWLFSFNYGFYFFHTHFCYFCDLFYCIALLVHV